ncbi:hypothetical protein Harman_31420 [Haloarcula mannanilytica]|uniref:Uncharacterized protein n=1 Tax=Haloarcula mannanilytica TaxID=2509225 RepID=A0A4C2ENG2_9EURY|nr:hypothetical protein Harman_31420 [Haloarcula mannanilytica]
MSNGPTANERFPKQYQRLIDEICKLGTDQDGTEFTLARCTTEGSGSVR